MTPTFEFGHTEEAHYIVTSRAFVADNGMLGFHFQKEDDSFVDVVFSARGIQELQTQLEAAMSFASKNQTH